ncbi:MAG: DUF2062 domain-containing protein [Gammaproteobacteria bacterium]|nr:DUF2062 domain-containing protein [Gammaproteobacteria bacterium]
MPRKLIKKYMPDHKHVTENQLIRKLVPNLQDPGIWHINRRSISGGVAAGLFCAMMPIPFQMLLAAFVAILFRVNILIAVPTVWITNPFTMPPIFYFCYQVGVLLLGSPETSQFNFELSFAWLASELLLIWEPFLLGCFVMGTVSALLGYSLIRLLWRYHIWQSIKDRKNRSRR